MFVIIRDELEEGCEYKVINKSTVFDLYFQQHLNMQQFPHLNIDDFFNPQQKLV